MYAPPFRIRDGRLFRSHQCEFNGFTGVAQLARAPVSKTGLCGFDSCYPCSRPDRLPAALIFLNSTADDRSTTAGGIALSGDTGAGCPRAMRAPSTIRSGGDGNPRAVEA